MIYFLAWHFAIAGLCAIILSVCGVFKIHIFKKIKEHKKSGWGLLLLVLFQPLLYFTCEVNGINLTSSSESGVALACIPIATIIMSALILKKKPSKWEVLGITITLVGVIFCTIVAGSTISLSVIGYIFLLGAVIIYSSYQILSEALTTFTAEEKTWCLSLGGMIGFGLTALIYSAFHGETSYFLTLPFRDTTLLLAVLFKGIFTTTCAFLLANYALGTIGSNKTSTFVGVSTLVSILAGVIVLHEIFTTMQIMGSILIIIGTYVSNIHFKNKI